ncbi:MAG: hypothetical protein Q9210_000979 [Variospora velana]
MSDKRPIDGYVDPLIPNPNGPGDAPIIIYGYTPHLELSALALALFGVLLLFHSYRLYQTRLYAFSILLVFTTFCEIIGYAFRLRSSPPPVGNPYDVVNFVVQYFFIVCAPVFLSAAIYTTLTSFIRVLSGNDDAAARKLSPLGLTKRTILAIFITADVVATIVQVAGAALIGVAQSNRKSPTTANNILLAGLAFQVFSFLVFLILLFIFLRNSKKVMMSTGTGNGERGGVMMAYTTALVVSSLLLYLRTIFRLAETAEGIGGSLQLFLYTSEGSDYRCKASRNWCSTASRYFATHDVNHQKRLVIPPCCLDMARSFHGHMGSTRSTDINPTSVAATRAWDPYPTSIKYEDAGRCLATTHTSANTQSSKNQKGLRLTKIKSSPSHGALAAARTASRQTRAHRRGRSASETASPITPTFIPHHIDDPLPALTVPPSTHAKPYPMAPPASLSKTKVKIRPLLRKLSSQDENTVDLSKSAAENESRGIYTSSAVGDSRRISSDVVYTGYHNRTTSEASQFSTTTTASHQRYGTQYVHPMRQTPATYTPPLASSFANSLESGEYSPGGPAAVPNDFIHSAQPHQQINNPTHYAPLPSARRMRPPLHVSTGLTSRVASPSQTNLPCTPSSLRRQTDHPGTPVAMVSTRTSYDSMFHKRSRANTNEDPVVRAAQVAILRREFDERERVKDEQRREQEARRAQKDAKKQQKRDESQQRKSETLARKRAQSNAASEKSALRAFQTQQASSGQNPGRGATGQPPRRKGLAKTFGGAWKATTNRWQVFVFWFKTLLLKMKRRVSGGSA